MKRAGLGKGLGMGYKNLIPIDKHIHSLSAKGIKSCKQKYSLNMLDLGTINRMNNEAGNIAKRRGIKPYKVWDYDELDNYPPFPFPYIGDYVPKGYKLVKTYFVDSSGVGLEEEPALTIKRFKQAIKPGRYYAIISQGEFQVYVGEFEKMS